MRTATSGSHLNFFQNKLLKERIGNMKGPVLVTFPSLWKDMRNKASIKRKGWFGVYRYWGQGAWQLEQQAESLYVQPQAGSREQTGNDMWLLNLTAHPYWHSSSSKPTPPKPPQAELPIRIQLFKYPRLWGISLKTLQGLRKLYFRSSLLEVPSTFETTGFV